MVLYSENQQLPLSHNHDPRPVLDPKEGKEWHRLFAFHYLSSFHKMETNCRFLIIHMRSLAHLLPEQTKWLCHKGSPLMCTLKDWQLPDLPVTDFHGNSTSLKKDICKETSLKPCCQQPYPYWWFSYFKLILHRKQHTKKSIFWNTKNNLPLFFWKHHVDKL